MSAVDIKSALVASNTGYRPPVIPSQAGEVIAVRAEVTVPDDIAEDSRLWMVPIPPECVPVDVILDVDELDEDGAAKTMKLDVGILNEDEDDLVANIRFIDDDDTCQSGGVKRADEISGFRIEPEATDVQVIAVKVRTAAGTGAEGKVGLTVLYRAASYGA